jgi:hypothetical protein
VTARRLSRRVETASVDWEDVLSPREIDSLVAFMLTLEE